MAQQQNPRSLINQFYQRVKADPPRYECEASPVEGQMTRFICTLTLPAVSVEGESLSEQVFQEEGRSKKAAQDAAAALAFRFLSEQQLYGASKPYEESLLRTLATKVLSPQGLLRDPEIHGAAAAAMAHHEGWLPLAALAHSRILRGWAKEYGAGFGADLAADPAALVDVVRRELTAQAAAGVAPADAAVEAAEGAIAAAEAEGRAQDAAAVDSKAAAAAATAAATAALGLALGPSGLCVRLPADAAEMAPPSVLAEQQEPEVAAAGGLATLVVVPADASLPLREETLPARGSLLDAVAALLACPSPHHVLQWGRVGHKATCAADPRVAVEGVAAAAAHVAWAEADTALGSPRPTAEPVGGAAPGAAPPAMEPDPSARAALARGESATFPAPGPVAMPPPTPSVSAASQQSESLMPPPAAANAACVPWRGEAAEPAGEAASGSAGDGAAAGGSGGGGVSSGGAPARPPASLGAYRADSTLTLAVHRGPAAMDWEGDGQNEVRGPEHPAPRPTEHTKHKAHPHPHRQARTQGHSAGSSGAMSPPGPGPATLRPLALRPPHQGPGGGAPGGNNNSAPSSGAASPRANHPSQHPSLITLLEPSLYSKLLLPPLPPPGAADASPPPPLSASAASGAGGLPYADALAGEPLNVRATWLAGRPLYGDAVATTCRQSPTPHIRKGHHVMKWRRYGPADFWRTATAATPAAAATRALHAHVLLRGLPAEYRGPASWQGPSPRQLLDAYAAAHAAAAPPHLELRVPDVDLPGEGTAELSGTNFLGMPYSVTAGPGSLEVAAQQAALAALWALQDLDARALAGGRAFEGRPAEAGAVAAMEGVEAGADVPAEVMAAEAGEVAEADVEVVTPGLAHARQPQDGATAKAGISYTIYLSAAAPSPDAMDAADSTGPGPARSGPLPAAESVTDSFSAVMQPPPPPAWANAAQLVAAAGSNSNSIINSNPAGVAGEAAGGCGVGFAGLPVLERHTGLTLGVGSAGAGAVPRVVDAALRRLRAVTAVLRREGVQTLVDLGCGECRLVESLLLGRAGADCGGPLRRAVGADISRGALGSAARRLAKMTAAAVELERMPLHGEEVVPRPVEVSLYCGSAMSPTLAAAPEGAGSAVDPWVGLRGCDAATLIEVVEHLDPEPLALVGPCVLGGLRPRVLVVTTPNWEYNAVMRSCEAAATAAAPRRKGAAGSSGSEPGAAPGAAPVAVPSGNWPGPPGRDGLPLRCADHRFEWDRAEFHGWCGELAERWGYSVSYEDIGRANNEAAALAASGYSGPQDPGPATQMAVFRRRQGDVDGEGDRPDSSSSGAYAEAARGGGVGSSGRGGSGSGWELVWGPARVAVPREELEEAEAEADGAVVESQGPSKRASLAAATNATVRNQVVIHARAASPSLPRRWEVAVSTAQWFELNRQATAAGALLATVFISDKAARVHGPLLERLRVAYGTGSYAPVRFIFVRVADGFEQRNRAAAATGRGLRSLAPECVSRSASQHGLDVALSAFMPGGLHACPSLLLTAGPTAPDGSTLLTSASRVAELTQLVSDMAFVTRRHMSPLAGRKEWEAPRTPAVSVDSQAWARTVLHLQCAAQARA
ncbi:hypothetical protein GPECTOR_1g828 [Gonium pectorale]|uniref:Small RNA 2'-O-methyltransferase n=1 Tax=Gonium pectorale TaxID=33097 RepID=A0A150H4Z6_GONPE|nr:hypothetical protein GPECTOR_1g828 [Gonium pectorale]|eukprot:KXZ56918.1 hypothetical protein GPECTOR_1g828 [Gonium pectorale]